MIGVTANPAQSVNCYTARFCLASPCVNPASTPDAPAPAAFDINCNNPPKKYFGNQCVIINRMAENKSDPNGAYSLIPMRPVCTPPGGKPLLTDKCGNRMGAPAPGGAACTILVGSCGFRAVTAGC